MTDYTIMTDYEKDIVKKIWPAASYL